MIRRLEPRPDLAGVVAHLRALRAEVALAIEEAERGIASRDRARALLELVERLSELV